MMAAEPDRIPTAFEGSNAVASADTNLGLAARHLTVGTLV